MLSIRPTIIYKYQHNKSPISVNNTTANLCFPLGIKICLEQNQFNISTPRNITTILTTEHGERYYMVVFYYYIKLSKDQFDDKYQTNPMKLFNLAIKSKIASPDYEKNINQWFIRN